jgi:hypothetical protein
MMMEMMKMMTRTMMKYILEVNEWNFLLAPKIDPTGNAHNNRR